MMFLKNKIINSLKKYSSSLVKFTGLLVSIGVLVCICSCGDGPVLYDSQDERVVCSDNTFEEQVINLQNTVELSSDSEAENDAYPEESLKYTIFVHVCGAVIKPGVYEMEGTSRVIDAIERAGGLSEDACGDALNLAMPISDGSRIYIPTYQEIAENDAGVNMDNSRYIVEASTGNDSNDVSDSNGLININTAGRDELMSLNGIGGSRADAIISYRENNGPFKSAEDIMNVNGIKSGSFDKIKDKITVR